MQKSTRDCHALFALAFSVLEILTFKIFDLQKVGQGGLAECKNFRNDGNSMANVNIQETPTRFCARSIRFRVITMLNFLPFNSRSRSRSSICKVTPFAEQSTMSFSSSNLAAKTRLAGVAKIVDRRRPRVRRTARGSTPFVSHRRRWSWRRNLTVCIVKRPSSLNRPSKSATRNHDSGMLVVFALSSCASRHHFMSSILIRKRSTTWSEHTP